MNLKRILLSAGTAVFMGALIAGGTGAFFSDSETSTGNVFAAGDIDLQIDNESYVTATSGENVGKLVFSPKTSWAQDDLTNQVFFDFDDVKPGDIGEDTISIHVGSNDAYACMAVDLTSTPDNGLTEPEGDVGDITDGPLAGELQEYLNFSFWKDDGDNVFEEGESQITQLTGLADTIFTGAWLPLADANNGDPLVGDTTNYVAKAWCFGTLTPDAVEQDGIGHTGTGIGDSTNGPLVRGTGFICNGIGDENEAQTDSIVADVAFHAVQSRNNDDFLCSSLPPLNQQEQ